jgi:transposase
VTINEHSEKIICTAFGNGSTHDFQVFKASRMILAESILCLADRGYQGLDKIHANSRTPAKKSKHHPLTPEQKIANRELARRRILAEHVIRRLKIFRILSERYRNRRKRFRLRFNLIAAIYNIELKSHAP